jgi:hypothetical protein
VWHFQAWAISNAGDDRSVVLNAFQDQGLKFITTGVGDHRLGYFGWTAPEDCDPTDVRFLAMANPNLGRRIDVDALIGKARRALAAGGEQLVKFRTEVLCTRVKSMVPLAIELDALAACVDPGSRLIGTPLFAIDVELDRSASVIGAFGYRGDGLRHAKVIDYRPGTGWLLERVRQLQMKWEPSGWVVNDSGPAAALIPDLEKLKDDDGYLLNVNVVKVNTTQMGNACGHLQDLTANKEWRYPGPNAEGDDYVADALEGSTKRPLGDRWAWDRRGDVGIAPLVCVTEGLWGLTTVPPPRQPWFGAS